MALALVGSIEFSLFVVPLEVEDKQYMGASLPHGLSILLKDNS